MIVVRPKALTGCLCLCAVLLGLLSGAGARAEPTSLKIKPSDTDSRISDADWPHLVLYDRTAHAGKILLWLPGTNGRPGTGPLPFYETAVAQGYRVIALSYVDAPAVAQICTGADGDPDCPAKFREKRIYGDDVTAVIRDAPQDAVINRFAKLLRYLASADMAGDWGQYLDGDSPRWDRIVVSGHSQGGGMAAFIAKHQSVAGVIMFSGGWDQATPGRIASWYAERSATPPGLWFGSYHVLEPYARLIARTYASLRIPAAQTFAFDLPVPPGRDAHSQGMSNPDYRPRWVEMLGRGF